MKILIIIPIGLHASHTTPEEECEKEDASK
jgi:hypothetical protein